MYLTDFQRWMIVFTGCVVVLGTAIFFWNRYTPAKVLTPAQEKVQLYRQCSGLNDHSEDCAQILNWDIKY